MYENLIDDLESDVKFLNHGSCSVEKEIAEDVQRAIDAIKYLDNRERIKDELTQSFRDHWWDGVHTIGEPCPCCGQPISDRTIHVYPVGTTIWSAAPFKDGKLRKGTIVQLNIGYEGLEGFWASFEDYYPVSAEFLCSELNDTWFLKNNETEVGEDS